MDTIVEWIKQWLIPGSFSFFLLGAAAGVILLNTGERLRRWGQRWLTALVITYAFLAMPPIASGLETTLQGKIGTQNLESQLREIDAVVVLGGGGVSYGAGDSQLSMMSESSALRLLEGYRLWKQMDPEWIVVSGGANPRAGLVTPESETMSAALSGFGVPPERILLESRSANTHDQAVNLQPLFDEHGIGSFILITSPTHIRRATLTFQKAGLDPIPAAALEHSQTKGALFDSILPNLDALGASRTVMREFLAIVYYALRGWI